jgi:low temperature requirement protein LtrA
MSNAAPKSDGSGERAVTPLEFFFDLVFVFAITQVTQPSANRRASRTAQPNRVVAYGGGSSRAQ